MINRRLNVIFLSLILIAGCSSSTKPEENIVLPESNLNFNDHIYPLFISKCSSRSGCHALGDAKHGLELTNYPSIITHFMSEALSVTLVIIEDGENSPLYKVLIFEDFLGTPRMPSNGPYLNANQYNGVKKWINEGAIPSANK